MIDIESFFSEHPSSPAAAFTTPQSNRTSALEEVHEAASFGLWVYPVTLLAKLTGKFDQLIDEATCEISRLEELAVKYSPCQWRIAIGRSSLCVIQLIGPEGRNSFAKLAVLTDCGECLTLQARRGETVWALFRRPRRALRKTAKTLAPGMTILADGDSCVLESFANPWAEIEAFPYALLELVFESPDNPPRCSAPVPLPSPRPSPCLPAAHFAKLHRGSGKAYPNCNQAGWRTGGYRVSRRS
jgi:hypothetical protein